MPFEVGKMGLYSSGRSFPVEYDNNGLITFEFRVVWQRIDGVFFNGK